MPVTNGVIYSSWLSYMEDFTPVTDGVIYSSRLSYMEDFTPVTDGVIYSSRLSYMEDFRGSNILSLPRINTTSYGSKSIRYFGPKKGNFLDDNLRTQTDLQSFKKFIQQVNFENL